MALNWGINGVSWLSTIVAVVDFVISAWLVNKLIDAPLHAYVRTAGACLGCGARGRLCRPGALSAPALCQGSWNLLLAGTLLVLGYFGLSLLIDVQFRSTVRTLLRQGRRLMAARHAAGVAATGR